VLLCVIVVAALPHLLLARPVSAEGNGAPPQVVHSRRVSAGISGGLGFLSGTGSELWSTGLRIGAHGFFRIAPFASIGGCFSYNRWTPDEDALIGDLDYPEFDWDVSGSLSIIEIAPAVRLFALPEEMPVQAFLQLGVGLYLIDAETTIDVSYAGESERFDDERSENKVGMSLGVGMSYRFFEILPSFTIAATEDGSTTYYSISAGASFAF
jgi:hypothetical protein